MQRHAAATLGFTLTEVLVSIVVIALGVLGAASMQLSALRTSQQSGYQTAALLLATEMAEKMRSNSRQAQLAEDVNPFLNIDYSATEGSDPSDPPVSCLSTAADCDAVQLAAFDIHELKERIKSMLPQGRVRVCRDADPWDSAATAYKWPCSSSSAAPIVIKIGWHRKDPVDHFPPSAVVTVEPHL